jgi:hypothetical protein
MPSIDRLSALVAISALDALEGTDCEVIHSEADKILLAVVPREVAKAYERVVKRTSWWAAS